METTEGLTNGTLGPLSTGRLGETTEATLVHINLKYLGIVKEERRVPTTPVTYSETDMSLLSRTFPPWDNV